MMMKEALPFSLSEVEDSVLNLSCNDEAIVFANHCKASLFRVSKLDLSVYCVFMFHD